MARRFKMPKPERMSALASRRGSWEKTSRIRFRARRCDLATIMGYIPAFSLEDRRWAPIEMSSLAIPSSLYDRLGVTFSYTS
jgi:hypothetical protein